MTASLGKPGGESKRPDDERPTQVYLARPVRIPPPPPPPPPAANAPPTYPNRILPGPDCLETDRSALPIGCYFGCQLPVSVLCTPGAGRIGRLAYCKQATWPASAALSSRGTLRVGIWKVVSVSWHPGRDPCLGYLKAYTPRTLFVNARTTWRQTPAYR